MSKQDEIDELAEEVRTATPPERKDSGLFLAREGVPTGESVVLTPEQIAARKRRNIAIALSLLGFCALVFIVTLIKIGQNLTGTGAV